MKLVITKKTIIMASVKLLLLLTYALLTSCKSTKSGCDAYGSTQNVKDNFTRVKIEHCHINEDNYCFYSIDTIF